MRKLFFAILLNIALINISSACTMWGTIKPDEILVAKTRDFYPGNQVFVTVSKNSEQGFAFAQEKHKKNYKFFGLYAEDHDKSVLKMGINEKGLAVLIAFASTIPLKERTAKNSYDQVAENILTHFDTVADISKNSGLLFKDSTPVYYLFADRQSGLLCEIGLNSHYQCKDYSRKELDTQPKFFAQTNHYIFKELRQYNLTPPIDNQSSYRRFEKINELMSAHFPQLTFQQFIKFSLNTESTNDEPLAKFDNGYDNTYQDNSIFRTFNVQPDRKNKNEPSSPQGLAAMIIELPRDKIKPIRLYLRITNKINNINHDTQKIEYKDTIVTLEDALNHPDSISYQNKLCTRYRKSTSC